MVAINCSLQQHESPFCIMFKWMLYRTLRYYPVCCGGSSLSSLQSALLICSSAVSYIDMSSREVMSYLCWRLARSRLLFPAIAGWMYSCRHELTNILYMMTFIYWTDTIRCRDSPRTSESSDGKTGGIWCCAGLILQCCCTVFEACLEQVHNTE